VSQENVNQYRRSIAAWNSGDLDGWLALAAADPDSEFKTSGMFPGVQRVYRGVEGMRQLWTDMRGPWESFHMSIERIEDLDDVVLALFTFEVTGRDGLTTSREWAHVVKYDSDKPTITENFASWEQALKAVGLQE
jgi:ketosteroid isomerase-like protein